MPDLVLRWSSPTEADLVALGLQASAVRGELLKFENAVLARAETNKNDDQIDAQGLNELAATLPMTPLDLEHIDRRIIGFFLAARVVDEALFTDGIVYARRFPDEAEGIRSGRYGLSIEADVDIARCSVCGGKFRRADDYCEHLKNRPVSGARRLLSGLKAIGGGITVFPAGTACTFDTSDNGLRFIASMADAQQDTAPEPLPAPITTEAPMPTIEELQAQVSALTTERDGVQASLATAQADLATAQANVSAKERVFASALSLIRAGFSPDEVEALGDKLATTDQAVLDLLASTKQQAAELSLNAAVTGLAPAAPVVPAVPQANVIGDQPVTPSQAPAATMADLFGEDEAE